MDSTDSISSAGLAAFVHSLTRELFMLCYPGRGLLTLVTHPLTVIVCDRRQQTLRFIVFLLFFSFCFFFFFDRLSIHSTTTLFT